MRIVRSATFDRWLRKLNDRRATARVLVRIGRRAAGDPGDVKPVGHGVLRIDHGPATSSTTCNEEAKLIVLLCGGDESSQGDDIERAQRIAADWRGQTYDEHNTWLRAGARRNVRYARLLIGGIDPARIAHPLEALMTTTTELTRHAL